MTSIWPPLRFSVIYHAEVESVDPHEAASAALTKIQLLQRLGNAQRPHVRISEACKQAYSTALRQLVHGGRHEAARCDVSTMVDATYRCNMRAKIEFTFETWQERKAVSETLRRTRLPKRCRIIDDHKSFALQTPIPQTQPADVTALTERALQTCVAVAQNPGIGDLAKSGQ